MIRLFCVSAVMLLMSQSLLAVPVLGTEEDDVDRPPTLLEVGLQRLQAGELDAAENALRGYLRAEPRSTETMMWLAEVLFLKDNLEGAGAQVRRVIQLDPDNAAAHHSLSRYHYVHRDFDASMQSLQRAIELDPSMFAARIDLADHYMMVANDVPQAIAAYEAAIAINPEHAGARYGLGVAHNRAGDFEAAEDAWRYAAMLEPTNPLPMYALGNSLMMQGKGNEAFAVYAQALEAEPQHIESMLARGRIYASRGEAKKALRDFDKVLAIAPGYAPAYLNIGLLKQQRGDDAAAIAAYKLTLQVDDAQPLAHNNLAWLLAMSQDSRGDALRHARIATELQPRIGPYWDTLGWIQHLVGDNEAARTSLEKAIELQARQPGVHEHLAKVYVALGDAAAAADVRRKASSLRED